MWRIWFQQEGCYIDDMAVLKIVVWWHLVEGVRKRDALLSRACLDQHLIAIRSPGICCDLVRSGTSLIAIVSIAQLRSQSSATVTCIYQLWLINCTVLHATWWARCTHQQPVLLCIVQGDQGVPEWRVHQWVGTHVYHITWLTAVAARRQQTVRTWCYIISQLSLGVKVNDRSNDGWCAWIVLWQTFIC